MIVDGGAPIEGEAAGTFQGLDLLESLYVGGVPDYDIIHRLSGFRKGQGFMGKLSLKFQL